MERLPQPLLVFGYNTEGNQHCWSMGWGEPRGEENHGSSRREHSAPAAAVWPEDGDGLGRPKFHAASCWATSKESFVLWTSLPQSFPHLFSEVLQNLLMWLKKKAQHQVLLTRIKVQSSLDSAAQSCFPLIYLVGHEPAFGLPDSHLQYSWTDTRNHWDHDCNCGFGTPTPWRTAEF